MKAGFTTPTVEEQIIAFADLTGFHRQICLQRSPEETFTFLSEYYAAAQQVVDRSGGRIVKFIGDALMVIFPSTDPNHAVATLRELKAAIESLLQQHQLDCRIRIKAHVGMVAAGMMGAGELERFDVCGLAVNQAALLPNEEWVLSDELRRRATA